MESEVLEKWVADMPEALKAMNLKQVRLVKKVVCSEYTERRKFKWVQRLSAERIQEVEELIARRREELTE